VAVISALNETTATVAGLQTWILENVHLVGNLSTEIIFFQHNLKIIPKLAATFRSPTASFIRLVVT